MKAFASYFARVPGLSFSYFVAVCTLVAVVIVGFGNKPMFFNIIWFGFWVLAVPLAAGYMLTLVFQDLLHTPYAGTLPGLQRKLLRGFAVTTLLFSFVCGAFGSGLTPGLPLAPSWGLAWFLVTLTIPSSPAGWHGSHWATGIIVVAVLFCLYRATEVLHWLQAQPVLAALICGAGAILCLRLGFDRDRLREKAAKPRVSQFASWNDENVLQQNRKLLAKGRTSKRVWSTAWLGNSLSAWTRAAWHENHGVQIVMLAAMIPLIGLGFMIFTQKGHQEPAEYVFRCLMDRGSLPRDERPTPVMMWVVIMAIPAGLAAGMRRDILYPISRRQRADVSYRSCVQFTAAWCGIWALVQSAIALIAWSLAEVPLGVGGIPWVAIEVVFFVHMFPFLQGAMVLYGNRRFHVLAPMLPGLGVFTIVAFGLIFVLPWIRRLDIPPGGALTALGLALALEQLALWRLLRWHFARCDLLGPVQPVR